MGLTLIAHSDSDGVMFAAFTAAADDDNDNDDDYRKYPKYFDTIPSYHMMMVMMSTINKQRSGHHTCLPCISQNFIT